MFSWGHESWSDFGGQGAALERTVSIIDISKELVNLDFHLLCHLLLSQLRSLPGVTDPTVGMGVVYLTFPPIPERDTD